MKIAGHQPNYLPYPGFFDKMAQADAFIIADDMQFERHDFQNRNRIKTEKGATWLTVPIKHTGKLQQIREVRIAQQEQFVHHWDKLRVNYQQAPHWKQYHHFFEKVYTCQWEYLIDLNLYLIKEIMTFLKIDTPLIMNSTLDITKKGTDRIISQCNALGADTYISGNGGHNYLNVKQMQKAGIEVIFQKFNQPIYPQLHGNFIPNLSIVDYLFCKGADEWKHNQSLKHKHLCCPV